MPVPQGREAGGAAPDDGDRDLVQRARERDQDAFRELVERHRDRAYALALRMVRSAPDAEEVAQDAFVRAWRALPAFRGDARFSTWLYRIVARCALDRSAVLSRRRAREAPEEASWDVAAPESRPHPEREAIERMLAGLTDPQRAAVVLFYYEDRSVEQVAEILGMPANTVKTHLSRARAALRKAWTEAQHP